MNFFKFADNFTKEASKVLNDAGSATSKVLNEAGKFTGEAITESVKVIEDVSSQVGDVITDVSEKAIGVASDVVEHVTKASSETFNEAGKIANNTKEQIDAVDLFNSKLRQEAVEGYKESIRLYNNEADNLANKSTELYQVREKAVKVVKIIEERISKLANKPKEFETKLEEIDVEIQNFEDKQIAISQSIKEAELASGSTAATASLSALGVTVATLGPTAAMGVATTFGVASTGTAISSLTGAAANSAALAWLGGGVAAGNAFLALAGPVGWGIAGVMLTASVGAGVVANRKNEEVAKEAIEEQKKVELLARQLKEKVIEVTELIELTGKQTEGIYLANLSLTGMDYSLFTEDEKYKAGNLVNSTLSLTAMINKEIKING